MKRLLLFYVCMVSVILLKAQPVDVTKLTADTKTYLFSDGKTTVRDYIYNRLQAQSTCCGSNRVYLEVRIDPTGYVLSAKALTGTNECYKESIIDIVKSIRWDATEFKGPKSVFIDLKPDMACEGRNNTYAKIEVFNNAMLDKNGLPISNASSTGVGSSNPNQPAVVTPPAPAVTTPPTGVVVNQPPVNPAPVVTPPAPQPVVTPPAPVAQPVVPAGSLVQMNAKPVGGVTTPSGAQLPPAPQAPVPAAIPPAPRGGPATLEADKARETQEEIAALRAELDRRAKEEEAKKPKTAAPAAGDLASKDAPKDDKKEGKEGEADWGIDEDVKKEMDCKAVLGRDGKPLVDKNGKPVMDCKPVAKKPGKEEKVEAPKPPTPEELAAKKAADEAAAEANKLAKMSPEEKRRYEDEKRRKDADEKMRAEEKAMQDKVAAAERSLRDAEDAKRKAEDEAKRKETEIARAKEDLQRVKVEAVVKKDEAELKRIDEEKRAAEEKKKEQEREIQKRMDDIKRMQQDMERFTSELQKQQEDLRAIEEKRAKHQQEAEIRKNGGTVTMDMPAATMPAPVKETNRNAAKADAGDSTAVNKLMRQIEELRGQIYRMQQENEAQRVNRPLTGGTNPMPMGGANAGDQSWRNVPNVPAPAGMQNGQPNARVESKSAFSNQEWMKIDYNNTEALAKTPEGREIIMNELQNGRSLDSKATRQTQAAAAPAVVAPAPVMPKKDMTGAPAPIVSQPVVTNPAAPQAAGNYVSTGDKNPDAIHADTYKNIPVASNGSLEYVDGEAGMKNYLRDNLKKAGVCGVSHVLAEVNVDRNGNVTSYKVLKTMPEDVVAKLPAILLGMKFKTNPATAPYSQTMYVEFKGEIRCEGKAADKTNVNQVEPFIKADKK